MLHKLGFLAAFQLTEPRDQNDPIMTIRRLIDCGYWSTKTFDWNVKNDFGRGKTSQKPIAQNKAAQHSLK
jgi:hypothetical protein